MRFNPNIPIYLQIMEEFKKKICAGKYQNNQKIESVRELALQYEVNPNTVQKALTELEKEGLLESRSTSGRFLIINEENIQRLKLETLEKAFNQFILEAYELGISQEELHQYLEEKKL